ncbi:hypothetical protein N7D90_15855 [Pseudomonas fragi]|uniref:hypothetical protein n=1 Tax=Pseudomonas fragi TaxID=296 RepID=UPI0021C014BB|nr:hypothetical protein [Pseudomonas fragi]UXL37055.1 hypothetical protein N7D90_15855 [Pseudomonas fragi]
MGVSVYYTAERAKPLSTLEKNAIESIQNEYSASINVEGECLDFYDSDDYEGNVILDGSVKLPLYSEDAATIGLRHWRNCLTELRRAISNAEWKVALEDDEFDWDEQHGWSLPGLDD